MITLLLSNVSTGGDSVLFFLSIITMKTPKAIVNVSCVSSPERIMYNFQVWQPLSNKYNSKHVPQQNDYLLLSEFLCAKIDNDYFI